MSGHVRENGDNLDLAAHFREAHDLSGEYSDNAGTRLIEAWIDEAERRA